MSNIDNLEKLSSNLTNLGSVGDQKYNQSKKAIDVAQETIDKFYEDELKKYNDSVEDIALKINPVGNTAIREALEVAYIGDSSADFPKNSENTQKDYEDKKRAIIGNSIEVISFQAKKILEIEAKINELGIDIAKETEEIKFEIIEVDTLKDEVSEIYIEINEKNSTMSENMASISKLDEAIILMEEDIKDIEKEIGKLENKISKLEDKGLANLDADEQQQLAEAKTEFNAKNTELTGKKTDLTNLQSNKENLEADNSSLAAEIDSSQKAKDLKEEEYTRREKEVKAREEKRNEIGDKYKAIEGDLETAGNNLETQIENFSKLYKEDIKKLGFEDFGKYAEEYLKSKQIEEQKQEEIKGTTETAVPTDKTQQTKGDVSQNKDNNEYSPNLQVGNEDLEEQMDSEENLNSEVPMELTAKELAKNLANDLKYREKSKIMDAVNMYGYENVLGAISKMGIINKRELKKNLQFEKELPKKELLQKSMGDFLDDEDIQGLEDVLKKLPNGIKNLDEGQLQDMSDKLSKFREKFDKGEINESQLETYNSLVGNPLKQALLINEIDNTGFFSRFGGKKMLGKNELVSKMSESIASVTPAKIKELRAASLKSNDFKSFLKSEAWPPKELADRDSKEEVAAPNTVEKSTEKEI
ncbi:MAG: hypothetical protein RSE00_00155 [Clostridia bacterium]